MGIFGALTTAVSGLRAQSYALENISGNIANSQTPGFKRVDTSFVDMIPELPYRREVAGSVNAFSKLTNTIKGDPLSTSVSTNVAINGEGFFIVREKVGNSGENTVFGGIDFYTRRGDFTIDKDGYLVNGAGYYLRGSSINPATGEIMGTGNEMIQISNAPVPAVATTEIQYRANLPSKPATSSAQATVADSELLGAPPASMPAGYDPRVAAAASPAPGVRGDDTSRFLAQSISGGAITIYDSVGQPINMELRWAKTSNASGSETWNLFYLENSSATGGTVSWRNVGRPVTFGPSGAMTSPSSFMLDDVTVDGAALGDINLAFGPNGLTQYSALNGLVRQDTLSQNGYPSGVLDAVNIEADGRVVGTYTNGRVVPVAQMQIAQFNADNALKRMEGGVYARTLESGMPISGLNGASLIGGHVESSNTDIAEEFSKMIVTQQAYSANTRVVSTSQQMMTEIINMIR
jgi:flagellar hook protein FlgE